jgi:hypothetical protein
MSLSFSLLKRVPAFSEVACKTSKSCQRSGEAVRKHPAFPVSVSFVEARYMVNEAETAHLAADNFKHPGAEAVSVANRTEAGQELPRGVLQLYKDSQKYPLMAAVARKKKLGKLIQGLDSCNPVAVKLDCGAWQSFSMIWYRDRAGTTLFHNELRRLSLFKSRIVKEHLCFQVGELPVLSIPEIEKVKSEWCYQFEIQLRPCATHLSKSVYSVC